MIEVQPFALRRDFTLRHGERTGGRLRLGDEHGIGARLERSAWLEDEMSERASDTCRIEFGVRHQTTGGGCFRKAPLGSGSGEKPDACEAVGIEHELERRTVDRSAGDHRQRDGVASARPDRHGLQCQGGGFAVQIKNDRHAGDGLLTRSNENARGVRNKGLQDIVKPGSLTHTAKLVLHRDPERALWWQNNEGGVDLEEWRVTFERQLQGLCVRRVDERHGAGLAGTVESAKVHLRRGDAQIFRRGSRGTGVRIKESAGGF